MACEGHVCAFAKLPNEAAPKPPTTTETTAAKADDKKKRTEIVFDDIRRRLSLIPAGLDVGEAFISPDGKTAVMIAGAAGQANLYSWSLDETARERPVARQLTTTAGAKADVSFSPDSKEAFYLDAGRIQAVTLDRRETRAVAVTAELDVDFAKEKTIVFDQAWRLLRDHFFDPDFNGVDWKGARAAVEPYIAAARTPDEMRRIASLMIGELNASHLGINGPGGGGGGGGVGHLGVDFDWAQYEKTGTLRITRVIPLGPAALAGLKPDELIVSVDGELTKPPANLDALLENKVNRRTVLGIAKVEGAIVKPSHDVPVLPISMTTERGLRYRQWVDERRAYVARYSLPAITRSLARMMVETFCGTFNVAMSRLASLTLGRKIASSKSNTIGGSRREPSIRSTIAGPIGSTSLYRRMTSNFETWTRDARCRAASSAKPAALAA